MTDCDNLNAQTACFSRVIRAYFTYRRMYFFPDTFDGNLGGCWSTAFWLCVEMWTNDMPLKPNYFRTNFTWLEFFWMCGPQQRTFVMRRYSHICHHISNVSSLPTKFIFFVSSIWSFVLTLFHRIYFSPFFLQFSQYFIFMSRIHPRLTRGVTYVLFARHYEHVIM